MKKSKIAFAVVASLLIICGFFCNRSASIQLVKSVKGPLQIKVHAVGQLKSSASTYIGCPPVNRVWSYTISSMAPEGKAVKAGEVILTFDFKELQERFMLKKSELDTARKELEKIRLVEQEKKDQFSLQLAEAKVKTEKAVRKVQQPDNQVAIIEMKKLRMDLELASLNEELCRSRVSNQIVGMRTRIHAQESKVKRLEKEVDELQEAIAKMKVTAPKPGIVAYALNWRGQKKAVGDRCWIGENILELPDLSRMQVAAMIPEPEAGKVKIGLPVEIRLDSNPDRVFQGKINSLGRIFRTKTPEQPAIVFDATIAIHSPDPEMMRPGMAAGVDIIVSSKEDVLKLPEAAVVYRPEGLFVWKKGFWGQKLVPIEIGARSGDMVEIRSGLRENDRVAIISAADGETG